MKTGKEKTARKSGVTQAELRAIALSFPGVREGFSYRQNAFLLGKKFFTRHRRDDDSVVLHVGSIDERDMLLEADPDVFHITDHYRSYPTVLARMTKLDPETLRAMLDRRWRVLAPTKRLKEVETRRSRKTTKGG